MPIYPTDLITLNGSQRCFGGQVFNASYQQGFNGQASSLDLDIISENRIYSIPDLNYRTPYNIKLGNNISLNMYASRYCIDDGDSGKILRVSFVDGSFRLKRYWIGIKSLYTNVSNSSANSSSTGTNTTPPAGFASSGGSASSNPTTTANQPGAIPACVIPLGKTATELATEGLPLNQFDCYSYDDFQRATSFLGIPSIPSNKYMTINMQGTVMDVFNYFMDAYGYSWYWGFDDKIHLVDLKRPVTLDDSIVNQFETHSKRLNSQTCTDITNTAARGAVAIENGDAEIIVLGGATPLWEGHFMGIPFKINDNIACIAAAMGIETYFSYMYFKYGLAAALNGIGYAVRYAGKLSETKCFKARKLLYDDKSSVYWHPNTDIGNVTADPSNDLIVVVYEPFAENQTVPFNIATKIGELLMLGTYYVTSKFPDLDINWTNVNATQLDIDAKLPEAIDWFDTLDFNAVRSIKLYGVSQFGQPLAGSKPPEQATLREIVGGGVWLVSQNPNRVPNARTVNVPPTNAGRNISISERAAGTVGIGDLAPGIIGMYDSPPDIVPIGTGMNINEIIAMRRQLADAQEQARQRTLKAAYTMFPQDLPIRADELSKDLAGPDVRVAIVNKTASKAINGIPIFDFSYSKISVKGIATYKDQAVQQIYNASNRRIVGQSFPVVDDSIAAIDVVSYENLSDTSVDPTQYLAQAAFKRDFPDKTYSCEIRGITLGFVVSPDDGLNAIRISLSQEGYRSNYELSTRKPKPAAIETFRQKFPIN